MDSGVPRPVAADNLRGWQLLPRGTNPDPQDNGTLTFLDGPETGADGPPLGTRSLRMENGVNGKNVSAIVPIREGNDRPTISELTTATYSSYLTNTDGAQDVSFKVVLLGANVCTQRADQAGCTPSASGFTTMIFEPSNNSGGANQNPSGEEGKWHRWNARGGRWWSTRKFQAGGGTDLCPNSGSGCTIDTLIQDSPRATVEQVRLEIGQNAGGAAIDTSVDDVRLGFDGDFLRYDLGG
jgi:hypothetical protein